MFVGSGRINFLSGLGGLSLLLLSVMISTGMWCQQSPNAALKTHLARPKFVDISSRVNIHFQHIAPHTSKKYLIETMAPGVALFDFDNDGRLDIFVTNGAPLADPTPKGTIPEKTGPEYWNRLYHQKADGTFEDVTEKAGLQGTGYGMGVAVGDYDNDGYEDLFVTAYGGNKLYHNNGNGTFTDMTEQAGVGGSGWSSSAAWVDLDGDGRLDLFVVRYVDWDFGDLWCGPKIEGLRGYCHPDVFPAIPPLVYHNDGNGHFTEGAQKMGLAKPEKGLGIALADYDRDGHLDIYVSNDSMSEFLFHNKGNGTFEEVALMSEAAVDADGGTFAGMGVDFSDYDNDGLPDIVVTDLANQVYALYHNSGDGTFVYSSYNTGISKFTRLHSGWGIRFMDYDNDGWKDLLIAQGHDLDTIEKSFPHLRYREPIMLMRNQSGKGFEDVSTGAGGVFSEAWVGRGMAVGDIDNDGSLDAVVATNGGNLHVIHNETASSNHWLLLALVGHRSNRDAIGAAVKLVTAQGPQYQTVTTACSYMSSCDKRVHFGLGADTEAEIEIHWPSGIVQVLKGVHADQILRVDEPTETSKVGAH